MKELDKLTQMVAEINELAQQVKDNVWKHTYEQGPKIVHQRLLNEWVNRLKEDKQMINPETTAIFDAINIIEKFYPEIKSR